METIWHTPFTVDDLNANNTMNLSSHLGVEFTEVGTDYIVAKMPVDERTRQPFGLLHGGASVVLAETLGSMAASLSSAVAQIVLVVGISINANHLKSVKEGFVYGKVKPIRIGRKIQVWEIMITNDSGDKVCISRLTTMILSS